MELHASLRYYSPEVVTGKAVRWTAPPHIYFVNLKLDWRSLLLFDKRFGVLLNEHSQEQEIAIHESDVELAKNMQRLLQGAWRGDKAARELLQFGAKHYAEQEAFGPIQGIKPVPTSRGVDIYTSDLWTYIRIAFLADQKRARVCANPDCVAPYFLAKRKDAKLCGEEECTAWAQRQWSLAWWKETGSTNRHRRTQKQSNSQMKKGGR
jgi:hypothetical protein